MELTGKIGRQVAHCLATYGDDAPKLLFKLECLAFEWYLKGVEIGIQTERKHNMEETNEK